MFGDELRSVIADDAWPGVGVGFTGALDDGFHVRFLHFLADFPVDDETAATVEEGTQKVKGAGDVQVTDIDVPVFVAFQWMAQAITILCYVQRWTGQIHASLDHTVDARQAETTHCL